MGVFTGLRDSLTTSFHWSLKAAHSALTSDCQPRNSMPKVSRAVCFRLTRNVEMPPGSGSLGYWV